MSFLGIQKFPLLPRFWPRAEFRSWTIGYAAGWQLVPQVSIYSYGLYHCREPPYQVVRRRLWHYITQAQEDEARRIQQAVGPGCFATSANKSEGGSFPNHFGDSGLGLGHSSRNLPAAIITPLGRKRLMIS